LCVKSKRSRLVASHPCTITNMSWPSPKCSTHCWFPDKIAKAPFTLSCYAFYLQGWLQQGNSAFTSHCFQLIFWLVCLSLVVQTKRVSEMLDFHSDVTYLVDQKGFICFCGLKCMNMQMQQMFEDTQVFSNCLVL